MNLNKESKNKVTNLDEMLMINISSMKATKKGKIGKYWLLVVDELTDLQWSFFLKMKSAQLPVMIGLIKG